MTPGAGSSAGSPGADILAATLTLAVLAGYLLGSCPSAAPISRRLYGSDVRGHGSGNAGAANMLRVFGWRPALAVLALDVAKGYVPALLASGLPAGGSPSPLSPGLAAGAAATFGHCYPLFAGFRGGKGVATAAGMFLATHPGAVLVGFGVFAAVAALSRYVSMAAVAAAAAMPATLLAFGGRFGYAVSPPDLYLTAAVAVFIAFTHRSNLSRLLRGREPRIGAGRGGGAGPAARANRTTTGGRT